VLDGVTKTATYSNYAIVGTATVDNCALLYNCGTAIIESATVGGGTIHNIENASIGLATVNYGTATIGSATIFGGFLDNNGNATISTLDLFSGDVRNGARIIHMTYADGNYTGNLWGNYGSIGTLTLAGNSANNTGDWGVIENLKFDGEGSGIVSITGFANGAFFGGIQVTNSVNLDNGGLSLNLLETVSREDWFETSFLNGFDISDFFGATSAFGSLNAFDVTWIGGSFDLLNAAGWSVSDTGWISYGGDTAAVPEPATLFVIGVSLAGLGLVRRRKRR